MMVVRQYAVIGLGRFGTSIARRLHEAGQEVLGIDINEERVNDAEQYVTEAVIADATEKKSLVSLEVDTFDCVIVAIGDDLQTNILTAMLLKELGVKKTIAKALGRRHGILLEKVGVDWVIYPERDMGERVANQLLSPNMLNYIELSKNYNIEEIVIPKHMEGKTLRELDIRAKYNLSVIALLRDGEIIVTSPVDQQFEKEDLLVMIGHRDDLAKFSSL